MNRSLYFLFVVATLVTFRPVFGQAAVRTGPSATWQVQKYDLDVSLPADSLRTLSAKAVLNLTNVSGQPASTLTLRISPSAEITSVRVNNALIDFGKTTESAGPFGNLQRITLRLPTTASGSTVTTTLDYKIKLGDNSGVGSISSYSSIFLPLSFWYPTPNSWFFPKGGDFAPVRIKVTTPGGLNAISSGVDSAGVFEQKLNAQPFFVAGNWEVRNESGVTVYSPVGSGAEGGKRSAELAELFTEAKKFLSGILGPAPDVPLRVVAARRGAGFSSGGTVIVEEGLFRRSKLDSLTAMNVAEAAARLWLGHSVSVNGDGFGVISEGLTRYLSVQFIESKYGKDVADVERLRQRNAYTSVVKRDGPMAQASPLDDYYYAVVANKGAMAWRLLASRVGNIEFGRIIRAQMQDGNLNLAELRSAFSTQKELLGYFFDQVTDMNLQIGLPQVSAGETRSALRNTGSIDATVEVVATTSTGDTLRASTTIPATNYGEVSFRTSAKIVRIEVDPENLYPQTEYSDDVQPRETTDSDPIIAAKREFDKQDFAAAEAKSRTLLRDIPHLDDLRIILGRSLLSQNKNADAEKEFKAVLDEKLPTARSLAWANVGLAESASRSNQKDAAIRYIDSVLASDPEYGAALAARNLRNKLGAGSTADTDVKAFFASFDKAASSNRKAEVDALVIPGEVTRFAGGVSGSTESWQTGVKHVDRVDANTVLVEAEMNIKLLNKEPETGIAVFRLVRAGSGWKLAGVEMFEVR